MVNEIYLRFNLIISWIKIFPKIYVFFSGNCQLMSLDMQCHGLNCVHTPPDGSGFEDQTMRVSLESVTFPAPAKRGVTLNFEKHRNGHRKCRSAGASN